jgi:hypothetical protein
MVSRYRPPPKLLSKDEAGGLRRISPSCRSYCGGRNQISGIDSSARRFPPPWSVKDLDACFVVRDHNGQKLAYVYFEDEAGRRSAAKLLTRDETRRIAVNMAKLPQFLLDF